MKETSGWISSYPTRGHLQNYDYNATLIFAPGLAVTSIAPPLPDVDGLRRAFWARIVVFHANLVHGDVYRAVERGEREVRQIDLVDLVEDLLTHSWISCGLLLREEFVQRRVAVEGKIGSSGRELGASKQRRVIGVVGPRILKLEEIIPACYCSSWR